MALAGNFWLPQVISYEAGADLTGAEGKFVKLQTDGTVILCSAATDRAIGVVRDGNVLGATVGVYQGFGIVPVSASNGSIAVGDLVGVTSGAQAVKLVAGTDTTKYIHGVAQEASTATGDLISVAIVIPTAKAA